MAPNGYFAMIREALRGRRESLRYGIAELVIELKLLNVLLAELRDAMVETGSDVRKTRKLMEDIRRADDIDRDRARAQEGTEPLSS